jgi:hypothetical protein
VRRFTETPQGNAEKLPPEIDPKLVEYVRNEIQTALKQQQEGDKGKGSGGAEKSSFFRSGRAGTREEPIYVSRAYTFTDSFM